MFRKKTLAVAVALGLGLAGAAAQATTFSFNPNGTGAGGAIGGVGIIDEAPGNVLAIGGAALFPGDVITDLYQANLGTMNSPTNQILFANGTGGNFFTFVAGFNETVIATGPGTAVFALAPGAPNFFYICAQNALGNDLAGTGFACADPILSGHATFLSGTQSVFPIAPTDLDQSPDGNQRAPTQTVTSNGATSLTVLIDSVNMGYFPSLNPGTQIIFSFTNTSQVTPFNQANPSFCFSSNGHADCDTPDNIGLINGVTGPNFQFQADANTSLTVRAIPEPGTLGLLGLAVGGLAWFGRRRDKA